MKKPLFLLISISLFISSCKKNDDQPVTPEETDDVIIENEANDFTWKAMNSFYNWQEEVIELSDDRFADENDYNTYLNEFSSPMVLFSALLSPKDRFSAIVDDYDYLFNFLSGVYKTNGVEYVITRPPEGGNKIVGVVRYVIAGSDAAENNIQRGDIFYAVNGTELFAETDTEGYITSSNLDLLDPDTFTLNFAEITEENVTVPNDINIELTKEELVEDPILVSKTLEVNGIKIGYLMYNSFPFGYDIELNNAIGELKSENIEELILDLRYNGGGSGQTARRLCSMITGQFTGELLARDTWNSKWDDIFGSADYFEDTIDDTPINQLNLEKLYVIATDDSASASEYVMNNLAPYIDVIHIGDVTVGKNQLSVTLLDNDTQTGAPVGQPNLELPYIALSEELGFTTLEDANPNHKYALQPIVGLTENSAGFGEYTDGLQPDYELLEVLGNLGQLGEQGEPLLDLAIEKITGVSSKSLKTPVSDNMKIKTISSSSRKKPLNGLLHKGFIGVN
ncbi:S41 family peptidase [Aurantibacter sp.]|uniref:S41 family peptidase n=1 Tax=Aurantibacter sp. TaxID=2807103 RepID=UPI00326398FC